MSSSRKRKLPPSPEEKEDIKENQKDEPKEEQKDEAMEEDVESNKQSSRGNQASTSAGISLEQSSLARQCEILYGLLKQPLVDCPPAPKRSKLGFRVQYDYQNAWRPLGPDATSQGSDLVPNPDASQEAKVLVKEKCDCIPALGEKEYESVLVLPYSQSHVTSTQDFHIYRAVQFDRFGKKVNRLVLVFPESFMEKMNPEPPSPQLRIRSAVLLKEMVPEEKWETYYEGTISSDLYGPKKEPSPKADSDGPNVLATHQQSFRIYALDKRCEADLRSNKTSEGKNKFSLTITSRPKSKDSQSEQKSEEASADSNSANSSESKTRVKGPDRYLTLDKDMCLLKLKHSESDFVEKGNSLIRHAVFSRTEELKVYHCYVVILPEESFGTCTWGGDPPLNDPLIPAEQAPVFVEESESPPETAHLEPPVPQLQEQPEEQPRPLSREEYPPVKHLSEEMQDLLHRDLRPEDLDTEWSLVVDSLDEIAGIVQALQGTEESSEDSVDSSASTPASESGPSEAPLVSPVEKRKALPSRVILEVIVSEGEESDQETEK